MLSSVPAVITVSFMGSLGNDRSGHSLMSTKRGHPVSLSIEILLCWDHPHESIIRDTNNLTLYSWSQRSFHRPLTQTSLSSSFPFLFLPSLWPFSQTMSHRALGLPTSGQNEQPCCLLKILLTDYGFPFTTALQSCPGMGLGVRLSSFRLCIMQHHLCTD